MTFGAGRQRISGGEVDGEQARGALVGVVLARAAGGVGGPCAIGVAERGVGVPAGGALHAQLQLADVPGRVLDHVAAQQGHQLGYVTNQFADAENHVTGVTGLQPRPVHVEPQLEILHVFDLVDEADWISLIKGRYESLLLEIFQ